MALSENFLKLKTFEIISLLQNSAVPIVWKIKVYTYQKISMAY